MADLTLETFTSVLNSTFTATSVVKIDTVQDFGETKPQMTLVSAEPLTIKGGPVAAPFILGFTSSRDLPQGTYTLEHPALGSVALFAVPHGVKDGLFQLSVVFN